MFSMLLLCGLCALIKVIILLIEDHMGINYICLLKGNHFKHDKIQFLLLMSYGALYY